jgi:hypothetical protein
MVGPHAPPMPSMFPSRADRGMRSGSLCSGPTSPIFPAVSWRVRTKPAARVSASCASSLERRAVDARALGAAPSSFRQPVRGSGCAGGSIEPTRQRPYLRSATGHRRVSVVRFPSASVVRFPERRRPLKSVGQRGKYALEFNGTDGRSGTR